MNGNNEVSTGSSKRGVLLLSVPLKNTQRKKKYARFNETIKIIFSGKGKKFKHKETRSEDPKCSAKNNYRND